jgi:hypothetical protein
MATTPDQTASSSFWDDVSQMLGKASAGAGSGLNAQAMYQNLRDRLSADLYSTAQNARTQQAGQRISAMNAGTQAAGANLAADKYRTSLAGMGAGEAKRGAILANEQPVSVDYGTSHITPMHFSGGLASAAITPETRAAGTALTKHGLDLLNNPGNYTQGSMAATPSANLGSTAADLIAPPSLSPELTPGFWQQASGAGSIASGLMSALAKAASGGNSNAASALKKLLSGGGGGNPYGPSTVTGVNDPSLPSYDPTNPTGGDPNALGNIGNYGQNPYSGIDTSPQNPEDPANATPDWWNQLPDSGE